MYNYTNCKNRNNCFLNNQPAPYFLRLFFLHSNIDFDNENDGVKRNLQKSLLFFIITF